ncbi:sensor domain-containing protein [Natronorubrum sulfidifaciens]|uniref:Two-component system sensor kinase n=1 Tax=Natronorubrum sulfidifaciens JCM 14089 TaxID=1230460 RepID=L9W6L6_9EURY|nr:sensor domain-containing protein [Natronorubrum sulfidifaciens]ELY45099.1 two-component system sensor kinase [Natronorubrum sulfidifaciens JCM 14089]
MAPSERTGDDSGSSIGGIVGVVVDRQTYKNLCYLGIAFPLAMVYSMLFLLGFGFGTILSMVGVGIVLLVTTVIGARLLAGFERWLANALLAVDLRPADDVDTSATNGPWATLRAYFDAPSTWRGLGFLMVKFWLGFVTIVLLFVFVTAFSLLAVPFRYPHTEEFFTVNDQPIVWTIDTLPEAALAVLLGGVLGLAFFHLSSAFAYVAGRMAVALLGESDALEHSPTDATE